MTDLIPSQAAIKAALQAYVDRTSAVDAADLVALFARDAVIENPVGSPIKPFAAILAWFADLVAFVTRISPVVPIR